MRWTIIAALQQMNQKGIRWPEFKLGEMADLIAWLKTELPAARWSDTGGPGAIGFDPASRSLLVLHNQPVQPLPPFPPRQRQCLQDRHQIVFDTQFAKNGSFLRQIADSAMSTLIHRKLRNGIIVKEHLARIRTD